MKMLSKIRRRPVLVGIAAVACLVAIVAAFAFQSYRTQPADTTPPATKLHADHLSYDGLNNIVGATDAVFIGSVISAQPGEDIPVPADAAGQGQPAIPQTDYAIRVDKIQKGSFSVGQEAHVILTGGIASDDRHIELEGVPELRPAEQYVFFLVSGGDGKYYPLAGGAAIATKNANGSFSLPTEVTGANAVSFTEQQLAEVPPPDRVSLVLLGSRFIRIDGNVESGSLSIARTGHSMTGTSGTVLVDGRVISMEITVNGWRASGTFALDETTYTLQSGVVTSRRDDGSLRIVGKAGSSGKAQAVLLDIFDR